MTRWLRWRYIAARRRLMLLWRTRIRPSRLQRDFDSGDPERMARVQAWADAIIAEMSNDDQETRS